MIQPIINKQFNYYYWMLNRRSGLSWFVSLLMGVEIYGIWLIAFTYPNSFLVLPAIFLLSFVLTMILFAVVGLIQWADLHIGDKQ